ncbi:IS701 family transposase [Xanthomonas oryzae]|uniref:IS701 family transposase n=1 Tax=Xanthomonas oryzae TaxID=347 RepID=UPI000E275B45|nr:IS701 family transposase [Xanthomonas oryzae]AXM11535.1 IS701 family transposase [Xanthomonas oryzae pv. oryzae]
MLNRSLEVRFEQYGEVVAAVLSHADRKQPAHWYLKGLLLPGGRKSVEPMAARVHPQNVRSAHQSMHHLVADADWSDQALLAAVAAQVLPPLSRKSAACHWIVDDTGFSKKGVHSVGVARQYCGRLGKTDNCQVAVSLSIANEHGSLPVGYRLYLPEQWAQDTVRRKKAGVPDQVVFQTKTALAMDQIDSALATGMAAGVVLADAAYGTETHWRDQLSERGLLYMVGVRSNTKVWWGSHQPAPMPPASPKGGRPRTRPMRDSAHAPISVHEVAQRLPARTYRQVSWRQGSDATLSSRFAAVRVRAAHNRQAHDEQWLLIEWPPGESEPRHYWFSTRPKQTPVKTLVATAQGRWRIERDYQELKSELGLHHYEGRNWRGFHHHASLCIAAYGFLMRERLRSKKNSVAFKMPAVSKSVRPRGSGPNATSPSQLDCHAGLRTG